MGIMSIVKSVIEHLRKAGKTEKRNLKHDRTGSR